MLDVLDEILDVLGGRFCGALPGLLTQSVIPRTQSVTQYTKFVTPHIRSVIPHTQSTPHTQSDHTPRHQV